ncbi:MAG TPA: hypothetical protein VFV78_11075 [Vicinamibacterales bacterium]|nr:hypothetical protein [Vicinamibacterales bacterium]
MTDSFRLQIPIEAAYRALVPEVASRYAELSGGSATGAAELAAAVSQAIERITRAAGPGAHVDLAFRPETGGLHVDLSCNGHRETVHVDLPVTP